MEIISNAGKNPEEKEQPSCGPEGEGKESGSSGVQIKENETVFQANSVAQSSTEKGKKETSLSSNLKKLVQSKSKIKSDQDEIKDDLQSNIKGEKVQKDSKISKIFQNVSASMSLRRVWGSSSATRVLGVEGEKTEAEPQRSFGKMLFKRKSLSRTDLETEKNNTQDVNKIKTLGRIFGRRSTSKTDVTPAESMSTELKSLTLGRRISSTFRGAFGKSDKNEAQAHEAPQ